MSADRIAAVVADLRRHRVRTLGTEDVYGFALDRVRDPVVVDATAIYRSLVAKDQTISVYEDHPCIAPPWDEAVVAYENEHGNVIAMHSTTGLGVRPEAREQWRTQTPVDWDRVRWWVGTFLWVGGHSRSLGAFKVTGPVHFWEYAIYEDGAPADLRWVNLSPDYPMENWDTASLVLLGTLNFLACRNVELVEPQRPRAERRRIAATGVTVKTLNVYPMGRSTRGGAGNQSWGVPLTSVRGSFHHYGPKYGRGLLFGKHEGKFWVPQHARGDAQNGRVEKDYRLHTTAGR